MRFSQRCKRCGLTLAVMIVGLAVVHSTRACDTPVYRYAMYRWLPAPYEVYYFYQDKMDASAEVIKKAIDKNQEMEGPIANIIFLPVDLNKDKDLTSVPPDVKDAWKEQKTPKIPNYLISSPFGLHLHMGPLAEADLEPLVDSPVRHKIGQQLESGKAGVFIIMNGEDKAANKTANKVLQGVVSDVTSGKVEMYSMPYGPPPDGEDSADYLRPTVGMVELNRDDPNEKWLLKTLLSVEPDLMKEKGPIIFLVYGRGRTLFSCLGKGIVRDNLLMDVEFITGACSCTVKDQNPGIDLLMRYDWDAAAMKLAQRHGPEEGNEYGPGMDDSFPELIIPSADEPGAAATDAAEATSGGAADKTLAKAEPTTVVATDSPADVPAASAKPDEPTASATKPTTDVKKSAVTEPQASVTPIPTPQHEAATVKTSMDGGLVAVGLGLGALLIVLFAATFLVLRPH